MQTFTELSMKLIKTLSVSALCALFALSASANEPKFQIDKAKEMVARKKAEQQKKNEQQKKSTQSNANERALKQFNQAVGLSFFGYEFAKSADGNDYIVFKYEVENKDKRAIRSLHWTATFSSDNAELYKQDEPLTFPTPLKSKQKNELSFSVLLNDFPEIALAAFTTEGKQIQVRFEAKNVTFSNGAKINVK